MRTENLTKALHSAEFLAAELREAHTDAVNSDNGFAEIVLFGMISDSLKILNNLERVKLAAEKLSRGQASA